MHPYLVFLSHKGRNFRALRCDCRLVAPIDFTMGISAGKLDPSRLNFVSVSDKHESIIKDNL